MWLGIVIQTLKSKEQHEIKATGDYLQNRRIVFNSSVSLIILFKLRRRSYSGKLHFSRWKRRMLKKIARYRSRYSSIILIVYWLQSSRSLRESISFNGSCSLSGTHWKRMILHDAWMQSLHFNCFHKGWTLCVSLCITFISI